MKFLIVAMVSVSFFSLLMGQENKLIEPAKVRQLLGPYIKAIEHNEAELKKAKELNDLGRVLYYDKRLSLKENISCNDCHDLQKYGTNGKYYLEQRKLKTFFRDVPSIYNKATNELFDWDAGQKSISAKTSAAIHSPHEMNMKDEVLLISRLKALPAYVSLFAKAFPGEENPVDFKHLVKALVSFQRGLITPSPIDRFLKGEKDALSQKQLKGAIVFDRLNCAACHTGSGFGGQMIQKLGITATWPNQKDPGHFLVSKNSEHKMFFRVSPLRNVVKTAPYFHDASSKRLCETGNCCLMRLRQDSVA